MSVRPVKLESSGSNFAIPASVSLITVPMLSKLSSSSGANNSTARSQNERMIEVSEVSASTAKQSASELLPSVYSRNSDARATMTTPEIHAPERTT